MVSKQLMTPKDTYKMAGVILPLSLFANIGDSPECVEANLVAMLENIFPTEDVRIVVENKTSGKNSTRLYVIVCCLLFC